MQDVNSRYTQHCITVRSQELVAPFVPLWSVAAVVRLSIDLDHQLG